MIEDCIRYEVVFLTDSRAALLGHRQIAIGCKLDSSRDGIIVQRHIIDGTRDDSTPREEGITNVAIAQIPGDRETRALSCCEARECKAIKTTARRSTGVEDIHRRCSADKSLWEGDGKECS